MVLIVVSDVACTRMGHHALLVSLNSVHIIVSAIIVYSHSFEFAHMTLISVTV